MVLGYAGAEGDDDELHVRCDVCNRNVDTDQRCKAQMSDQTQRFWPFPAKALMQVGETFCSSFIVEHGVGNMCIEVYIRQAPSC